MSDNFNVTEGTGTAIRAVEKSSKKTQVILIDWGAGGAEALTNPDFATQTTLASLLASLGAKTDAKSTATDATSVSAMQVLKEISEKLQNPPSQVATDGGPSWTSVFGVSGAAVVSSDMTTAAAVTDAPTSGQKICLDDIIISAAVDMNVLVEEQTSGTDLFKIYIPANGTVQLTPRGKMKLATADKYVTCKASVAGGISVTATYHSEA
jgi:hypothetical protein